MRFNLLQRGYVEERPTTSRYSLDVQQISAGEVSF